MSWHDYVDDPLFLSSGDPGADDPMNYPPYWPEWDAGPEYHLEQYHDAGGVQHRPEWLPIGPPLEPGHSMFWWYMNPMDRDTRWVSDR